MTDIRSKIKNLIEGNQQHFNFPNDPVGIELVPPDRALGSRVQRHSMGIPENERVLVPYLTKSSYIEYQQRTKFGPRFLVVVQDGTLHHAWLEDEIYVGLQRERAHEDWYDCMGYWKNSECEYLAREYCAERGIMI